MKCPNCQSDLAIAKHPDGAVWHCRVCLRSVANLAVMRKRLGADVVRNFWRHSHSAVLSSRHCPSCSQYLKSIHISKDDKRVSLDICKSCQILSFEQDLLSLIEGDSAKLSRSLLDRNELAPYKVEFGCEKHDMPQTHGVMSEMTMCCLQVVAEVAAIILDSS
jgi:hypothetical protein